MSNTSEAGRFSLAGFIFQLLGNGVELIQLYGELDDSDSPRDVLLLERFGQDSAKVDSRGHLTGLNQYKFTSTGATTSRASLREILEKLLASVNDAGGTVEKCYFRLTTNMGWENAVQELWDIQSNDALSHDKKILQIAQKLTASKQSGDLPDARTLAEIFLKLTPVATDDMQLISRLKREAASYGVLPQELEGRVNELLGLLLKLSGEGGRRAVSAASFFEALSGFPSPFCLLGEDSCLVRNNSISEQRELETDGVATTPRSIIADIVNATCQFPIVVLRGKGGSGKSVAAFDAAKTIVEDLANPPGFALVEKAYEIAESKLVNTIASWRNQTLNEDGPQFARSLERLRVAFPEKPKLVVCVDGVDERHGRDALPAEASNFIRRQALRSLKQHPTGSWDTTLLVTCREKNDWQDFFTHKDCREDENYFVFVLEQFTLPEMSELAATIEDDEVRELLENRISLEVDGDVGFLTDDEESINPAQFQILRRPVLWGIFREMTLDEKLLFLRAGQNGLNSMAQRYFRRFHLKCSSRVPTELQQNDVLATLVSAARSSQEPALMLRRYSTHWRQPAVNSGCSPQNALAMFDEACSAGLIRKRDHSRDWNWEHPWFLEYLLTRDEI